MHYTELKSDINLSQKSAVNIRSADLLEATDLIPACGEASATTSLSLPGLGRSEKAFPAAANQLSGRGKWLSVAIWVGAVVLCGLLIVGTSNFAQLGYDWGYSAVKQLIGQPRDDQGQGAMVLYGLVVPCLTVGMFAGYMQGFFGGRYRWRSSGLTAMLALGLFFVGFPQSFNDAVICAEFAVGATAAALAISFPFAALGRALRVRTRAIRLQSCLLLAVLPWWMLLMRPDAMWMQLSLYTALVFGVSLLAPLVVGARKKEVAVSSVFFATLPFAVLNLANVAFTLFSLVAVNFGFMNIGWHATLSASLITFYTLICSALGGAGGAAVLRLRHRFGE